MEIPTREKLFKDVTWQNYDVIGFDADHCLIKYNYPKLVDILYSGMVQILVQQRGYDKSLLQYTPSIFDIGLNYSFLDIKKGNIIKLGAEKQILAAYHGF